MFDFITSLLKPKPDLAKLVREGALIIDVRTKAEYNTGHIAGSGNVPLDRLVNETTRLKQLNKPVITVCKSGNRSRMARSILSSAGIKAYNGGAWTELKTKLLSL